MSATAGMNVKNTGVLLVTHGNYGQSLIAAAEMILGQLEGCISVGVDSSQDMNEIMDAVKEAVSSLDEGAGVLILTDMFGGTPTNISLSMLSHGKNEVLTGVNLPMLLKVLGSRTMDPVRLATEAAEAGTQGIVVAGSLLKRKISGGK